MKIRTYFAATAAAALVGTGAFVLPAAASTHATTHTLQLISVTKANVNFSNSTGAEQDTDVNSAGKVVGYDMLYFRPDTATTYFVNITGDVNGGMLYATGTINANGAFSNGKVTGGTGSFEGATGTITAKSLNKAGTRTAIKITYLT